MNPKISQGITHLASQSKALRDRLEGKGFCRVEVSVRMPGLIGETFLSITVEGRTDYHDYTSRVVEYFMAETLDDIPACFTAAQAWVDAQLPVDEQRRRNAFSQLGRAIDKLRDVGIDEEFVNPLAEQMKRLSENALTDQRPLQAA